MKIAGSHLFDKPIAFAVRVRGREGDLLELMCPLCKERHIHGAGEHGSPPGSGDGHRAPHCMDPRKWANGYCLIELLPAEAAA